MNIKFGIGLLSSIGLTVSAALFGLYKT